MKVLNKYSERPVTSVESELKRYKSFLEETKRKRDEFKSRLDKLLVGSIGCWVKYCRSYYRISGIGVCNIDHSDIYIEADIEVTLGSDSNTITGMRYFNRNFSISISSFESIPKEEMLKKIRLFLKL